MPIRHARCLAVALLLLLTPGPAQAADVPDLLNLQGMLRSNGGEAVTGTVSLVVRLYATRTASSALYTETLPSVTVTSGRFKVLVGSLAPIPSTLFDSNAGVYVGISVDGGDELTRRQLGSTPYALRTRRATSAVSADSATTSADLACSGCVGTSDLADSAVGLSQLGSDVSAAFVNATGDTVT